MLTWNENIDKCLLECWPSFSSLFVFVHPSMSSSITYFCSHWLCLFLTAFTQIVDNLENIHQWLLHSWKHEILFMFTFLSWSDNIIKQLMNQCCEMRVWWTICVCSCVSSSLLKESRKIIKMPHPTIHYCCECDSITYRKRIRWETRWWEMDLF